MIKHVFMCILIFTSLSSCQETDIPIISKSDVRISEVDESSFLIEWDMASNHSLKNQFEYLVSISKDPDTFQNNVLSIDLKNITPLIDWTPSLSNAVAWNLESATKYYVAVFVRNRDKTVIKAYKIATVTTLAGHENINKAENKETHKDLEMIFVEGGTFYFHGEKVEIENFYLSKFEVTADIYYDSTRWAIENGLYPSNFTNVKPSENRKNKPEEFTWFGILYFCNYLSLKEDLDPVYYFDKELTDYISYKAPADDVNSDNLYNFYIKNTSNGFRLPTEVEWEYAAKGGSVSKDYIYAGSNNPEDVSFLTINKEYNYYFDVGQKKANELGIYDLSGNINEWCIDFWDDNPIVDPIIRNGIYFYQAKKYTLSRVVKGGFNYNPNLHETELVPAIDINTFAIETRMKLPLFITYEFEKDTFAGLRLCRKQQ